MQQIDQRKKDMDRMDKKHEALIKDINGVYDALRNYMAKETENKVFFNIYNIINFIETFETVFTFTRN